MGNAEKEPLLDECQGGPNFELEESVVACGKPMYSSYTRGFIQGFKICLCLCLTIFIGFQLLMLIPWTRVIAWPLQHFQQSKHCHAQYLDFDDIIPSEKLVWHFCFPDHKFVVKCARLTVAMDYRCPLNESKHHPKVDVALVLVPGKHDGSRNFSTSPLLVNPGGPGGSGVDFVLDAGLGLQKSVGEERDVIGFDPRGVGATTPRADCFSYPAQSDDASMLVYDHSTGMGQDYARGNFNRMLWKTSGQEVGFLNSTSGSWVEVTARVRGQSRLCEDKAAFEGEDSIFKYLSTPDVARDMVSIIDAWDELADSLSQCHESSSSSETDNGDTRSMVSSEQRDLDTKGKLVYWGFSYGSLLGATFASMFPHRVGRVALDGVVDASRYIEDIWVNSLVDTDHVFQSFPRFCHEAGEKCALYRDGDSLQLLTDRFYGTLEGLKTNPIVFTDTQTKTPIIVTYRDLRQAIFDTLYGPVTGFPELATIVNDIFLGQGDSLRNLLSIPPPYDKFPDATCQKPLPAWKYPDEAFAGIMCSDKRFPLQGNIPALKELFEKLANESSFADVWLTNLLNCEDWAIEAAYPLKEWDELHQAPINTSFPLLFLSNSYDNVTPLRSAVSMAQKFAESGLIEQQALGHCTLSARSECTSAKIRAYFQHGIVPPHPKEGRQGKELEEGVWDRCDVDEKPFYPYTGSSTASTEDDADEQGDAFRQLQDRFKRMRHLGQSRF